MEGPGGRANPRGAAASAPAAPSRRTRDELRALILAAGVELARHEGLGRAADGLTFKRVFEHVERGHGVRVTHGSVIGRLWDSQADFQGDVILALIQRIGDQQRDRSSAVWGRTARMADRSTLEGRHRAVHEVNRLAGASDLAAILDMPEWRAWVGLWVLLANQEPASSRPPEVARSLRDADEQIRRRNAELLDRGLGYLGFRVRAPYEPADFAWAARALVEGWTIYAGDPATSAGGIALPTGEDGGTQAWTLYGVALDALVEHFFEPDPDWRPPADGEDLRGPSLPAGS